jgi:hypothetical protein
LTPIQLLGPVYAVLQHRIFYGLIGRFQPTCYSLYQQKQNASEPLSAPFIPCFLASFITIIALPANTLSETE